LDEEVWVTFMNERRFSTRRFRMSDVDGVVELFKLVFKGNFSREWWNWKYRANPAGFWGEEGDIWVAESGNKIVGHWAVIPEKIKIGSQTVTAAQPVDAATHPGYRKRGIYRTLVEELFSDIQCRYDFVFSFPVEVLAKSHIRHGWRVSRLGEFLMFLNYDRPLRRFSNNVFLIWSGKVGLKAFQSGRHIFQRLLGGKFVVEALVDSSMCQRY